MILSTAHYIHNSIYSTTTKLDFDSHGKVYQESKTLMLHNNKSNMQIVYISSDLVIPGILFVLSR